jgi:hypothetical protein
MRTNNEHSDWNDPWRAPQILPFVCSDRSKQDSPRDVAYLDDEERWAVAGRTVEKLKEHGDKWRLNEEEEATPLDGAHSSPPSFTEAHQKPKPP